MNENEVNAIERIVEDKQIIEVDGITYARRDFHVVEPPVKRPKTVDLNTLLSLVEFAKNGKFDDDKIFCSGYFALIDNNLSVSLYSGINPSDMRRTILATSVNFFERFSLRQVHAFRGVQHPAPDPLCL